MPSSGPTTQQARGGWLLILVWPTSYKYFLATSHSSRMVVAGARRRSTRRMYLGSPCCGPWAWACPTRTSHGMPGCHGRRRAGRRCPVFLSRSTSTCSQRNDARGPPSRCPAAGRGRVAIRSSGRAPQTSGSSFPATPHKTARANVGADVPADFEWEDVADELVGLHGSVSQRPSEAVASPNAC